MIETPQIIQVAARPTAIIPLKIPKDQIQHVMGPGIGELMSTVAAQGISVTGSWFTHHWKIDDVGWDFEISVPVERPIAATGRVKASEWPAMKASRTVYRGPYEGLGDAWGEFMDWLGSNGHRTAKDLWECYLSGPESGPDPAGWRTELTRQIVN